MIRNSLGVPVVSTIRILKLEYKSLQEEPVEGFRVNLVDESNIFEWEVGIFGPPDTIYEGGYFKAIMRFPKDYPYSPPTLRFSTKFWHPNVYATGGLCISILHPPGNDPTTDLKDVEKWNPAQNVRTVLLSVISLLNEPNTASPANVDACKMYKRWRDSNGKYNDYERLVKRQVELSKIQAAQEGIIVPTTIEDYCKLGQSSVEKEPQNDDIVETMDYYVDSSSDDSDYNDEEEKKNKPKPQPKPQPTERPRTPLFKLESSHAISESYVNLSDIDLSDSDHRITDSSDDDEPEMIILN